MANDKKNYVLLPAFHGVVAWTEKGKIALEESTTQTNLKYLHEQGHEGVRKIGEDKVKDESE